MKKSLAIIILCFLFINANAQLSDTKWKGSLNLDNPMEVYFKFTNDTLEVITADDNSTLETMKYSIQDSILSVQKLSGQSQCDNLVIGKYKYAVNGNNMTLNVMSDECANRSQAIGNIKLEKQ